MDSLLTTVFFNGKLHQSRIVKIFKLTSIVPMTGVTPGLLLWSPKSPRSYTYWDPRIHIIMSTGFLTNPSAVDHLKHFGVWLESFLSWDYHVNYICAKANKVLGLIRWTFGPNNSEGVSTAYKTLVRPILEYGCQVWNPYLVKHIKSIESIQRRATRVICGSEKEYQERLGVLKWPSHELRRTFICLVQMYKIIFGHCDIDPHMFFYFNVLAKTRRNHNFKIRPKKTRTNYFKFSFFNRYITDWNSLPSNNMHALSLSSFNSYLLDHLCQF